MQVRIKWIQLMFIGCLLHGCRSNTRHFTVHEKNHVSLKLPVCSSGHTSPPYFRIQKGRGNTEGKRGERWRRASEILSSRNTLPLLFSPTWIFLNPRNRKRSIRNMWVDVAPSPIFQMAFSDAPIYLHRVQRSKHFWEGQNFVLFLWFLQEKCSFF